MRKLLVVLFVFLFSLTGCGHDNSKAAPDVVFTKLNGNQFKTEDLKGQVTLIKFWATDCPTCIKQMPQMIDTYNKFHDQGYNVVAVAMKHDKPHYIKNFIEDRQLPFTVTHDTDGSTAHAFQEVRFTPVAFLIDRQGNIVKRFIGDYDYNQFLQVLEKTLNS